MINAVQKTLVRLASRPARETVLYNDRWKGHLIAEVQLPTTVRDNQALQKAFGPSDPLILAWPLKEAWLAGLIPKKVTTADVEQMTGTLIMNRDIAAQYPDMMQEYFPPGFDLSPSFLLGLGSLKDLADYRLSLRTLLDFFDTAGGRFRNAAIPIPADKGQLDGKYSLTVTRGVSECDLGLELSVILTEEKELLSATRDYETRGLFPRAARLGLRLMPESLDIVAVQGMIGNFQSKRYPSKLYERNFRAVYQELKDLFKGLDAFRWLTAGALDLATKLGYSFVRGIKAEAQMFTYDPQDVDWEHFRRMYDKRFGKMGFGEINSAAWLGREIKPADLPALFPSPAQADLVSDLMGKALLTLRGQRPF